MSISYRPPVDRLVAARSEGMVRSVAGMEFLADQLAALGQRGLRRHLRTVSGPQGRTLTLDGQLVLNFSSNNYLGLAGHADLVEAVRAAVAANGVGAGASRLISGNHDQHLALEAAAAELHGCEAALLFNSGYQANVGLLSSLAGREDVIVSDELNHASIIDGCRLSRAQVQIYRHSDADHVREILERSRGRRRIIVTESIFSMDGDQAPLAALSELSREHNAMLVVDEAHALGVASAAGLSRSLGVVPDATVATLGKALGAFGAYVVGSSLLRELLLNTARSFVFTTAPSLADVAASIAALRLLRGSEGERRSAALHERCAQLASGLAELGFSRQGSQSAIFPLIVGEESRAMECTSRLLQLGVFVQGIRPPTVPRGTARLRITLMADHSPSDVELLITSLSTLRREGLL